ncbi:Protein sidekick-1 [Desmophyllum pertusum]|uniref:Protein sidekick-1 n=1 Tax=Desmophyllum pertusum TaxID=174260 RepID=A0A9W9YZV0_9CNID|nr:Protein sidekick-1 [Desmophyllum pertusum]
MSKNLVYLNFLLVFVIQQRILAFQPVTENNHVLVGHVFQQLYSRDWFSCIQACQDEPRCISYNYERSARANGLCELNDCGVEDLCDRDKSLIYSVGFVFQQIRENKVNTNCSLDKNGPETKQALVPTAPPQNVTAVNKTSTSIFITWDAVPANQSNGDILGYRVNYTLRTTHDTRLVSVKTIYANLTGLKRNRMYNITVITYNQHGDGPPSKALLVRTDQGSKF